MKIKNLNPVNFIVLFFAGIINSVGVTMFLAPVNLYDMRFFGDFYAFMAVVFE